MYVFFGDLVAGAAPDSTFEKKTIYISKPEAERIFGSAEKAIGKVVDFPKLDQLIVRGVFEEMPENSHLAFNMLISFAYANDLMFYGSPFSIDIDVFKLLLLVVLAVVVLGTFHRTLLD